MRAGVSPEAQDRKGGKKEIGEEERVGSRVEAEIVRPPGQSTLEETDYEKQWEAKRAQAYAVHREHTVCRWVSTAVQKSQRAAHNRKCVHNDK